MENTNVTLIQNREIDDNLSNCTKEELIQRIKSLVAHNNQLKNIIAKRSDFKQTQRSLKPFDFSKYNFKHIALKLLYLGWDYKGYVVQEDTSDTVECYLFDALIKTKLIKDRSSSNYHRCGRTDKGVSSFGQVISIDVRGSKKGENVEQDIDYCNILNRVLPNNIQCLAWSPVTQDFSARFNCLSRTYKYYFAKGNLNINRMRIASQKFIGIHDFRNFCKMDVGNGVVEFIRKIFEIVIEPLMGNEDNEYSLFALRVKAKAFLWHQIRCIVGILFLIGQEKEEPTIIDDLLDIKKFPRKPDYSLASEVPLNLFFCEYDGLMWKYEKKTLQKVLHNLCSLWTMAVTREAMIKDMLICLKSDYECEGGQTCLSNELLPQAKAKTYIPLTKRPTCDSVEDKIKHFVKRKKLKTQKI